MSNFNYPSTSSSFCPLIHRCNHKDHRFASSINFRRPLLSFSCLALPPHSPIQWNLVHYFSNPIPFLSLIEPIAGDDGPVEILPELPAIFSTSENPTPLQLATSILLTGAISVFLFRSIRRRAKRSLDVKFRSSGEKMTLKDEAIERLKEIGTSPLEPKKPASPVQALLGGISAGVIALILYKFATTVEAGLNRQVLSDDFSVRQITITIRTIVNGLCYLVTFIFGINSVGLLLYSGQLAMNSLFSDSPREDGVDSKQSSSSVVASKNPGSDVELRKTEGSEKE